MIVWGTARRVARRREIISRQVTLFYFNQVISFRSDPESDELELTIFHLPFTTSPIVHSFFPSHSQYCSSKVHRLRQLLSLTHADPSHQPKSKSTTNQSKTSGKKGKGSKKAGRRQNPASQSAAEKGKGNQFTKKTLKLEQVENDR